MVLLATKACSLARVGAYGGIFLKMAYNLFGPRVDPHANVGANGSVFPQRPTIRSVRETLIVEGLRL